MTEVVNKDHHIVSDFSDVQTMYGPVSKAHSGKIGIEVEEHLINFNEGGHEMVAPESMETLQSLLRDKGYDAQLEAASVLEYASPACEIDNLPSLLVSVDQALCAFRHTAQEFGFRHAPFAVMPKATRKEALEKMNKRERLQTGIRSLMEVSPHGASAIALLTAGVQVSFSPEDSQQMFRMAYRAYALTPLLMAAMNNDCGYSENECERKPHHIRGHYYDGYGKASGIAEAFLQSENGEGFIQNHYQTVIHTPMYFAYGCEGELLPSKPEKIIRFSGLPSSLKTRANYELAESFLYHDVKICNLRDEKSEVIGKRLEVRAADSGPHQPFTTAMLTAAFIPDGKGAERFEALLKKYGFEGNPKKERDLFLRARHNVVMHEGQYMDVAFGCAPVSRRPLRLMDFAREVADLLDDHYGAIDLTSSMRRRLTQLKAILRTGQSLAAEHVSTFKTFSDVCSYLDRSQYKSASIAQKAPHYV